ncbi:hypothetical protein FQZ97_1036410 [compost metagenome]
MGSNFHPNGFIPTGLIKYFSVNKFSSIFYLHFIAVFDQVTGTRSCLQVINISLLCFLGTFHILCHIILDDLRFIGLSVFGFLFILFHALDLVHFYNEPDICSGAYFQRNRLTHHFEEGIGAHQYRGAVSFTDMVKRILE